MAVVKDPVGRARKARTPLQARRLREELEVELALNDQLDPAWERDADSAVDDLNARFGERELDDIDPAGDGAKGWTPGWSRAASKATDDTTDSPASTSSPDASRPAARDASRGARRERVPARSPTSRGTRSRARRGRRRYVPASVPPVAGVAEARAIGGQIVGIVLGASLLYLLIATRRGPSAVEAFVKSTRVALNAIVSPTVDPLRPTAAATTKAKAKASVSAATAGAFASGAAAGVVDTTATATADSFNRGAAAGTVSPHAATAAGFLAGAASAAVAPRHLTRPRARRPTHH